MADNTVVDAGSGGNTIRTLEDGTSVHWPVGVVAYATSVGSPDVLTIPTAAAMADGAGNPTTLLNGCCVAIFNGTTWDRARGDTTNGIDVDVTRVSGTVTVTGAGGSFPITDSAGSLTVDAPVGTPVFVRLSDGSSAIATLPVSLASVPSHAVTNAGTFVIQVNGDALTALQLIDDIVVTDGAAFTADAGKGVALMGYATSSSVTSGDVGAVAMLTNRQLKVTLYDSAGAEITAGGEYSEDAATPATIVGGTVMMERDDALSTLTPAEADWAGARCNSVGALWVETLMGGVAVTMGNGASGTGVQRVTIANDSTGILAGVTTVTTVTTCSTVTTLTGSSIAHDGADSGNPHKIGAKATTSLAGLTLVADADRTNLFAGVDGVQITRPHCNLEDIVSGNASNTDGASTQVIAAAGAGIKQYLTSITLTNTSATPTYCELKSGTTVRWTFPVPANAGVTHQWAVPLPPNAANEAWNFDMGAATTTAYCSMSGFKSKV